MNGWIKLHRDIQNHWIWSDKPFDKRSAWIDMIMMANHKDNKFVLGNELIDVKKGQFITSELKLMERWGWSKSKVRSFLSLLEKDNMITKETDKKKTTITIVNYCIWQDSETTEEPRKDHQETTKEPRKDTNKNDKNVKNDKNEKEYNKKLVDDSTESPIADEKPRYDVDSVYYQAALYLKNKILSFNPQCKVPKDNPKSMDKWANDIRLILERDKRTKKELATIIDYVFDYDDFWKAQIQSPSGLRKHWDKIQGKMLSKQNNSNGVNKVINFQEQIDRMADW